MVRESIFTAAILATLGTMGMFTAADAGSRGTQGTVIMFGANWCAPCRVELTQLRVLSAAAAPDALRLAWLEPSRQARAAAANANVTAMSIAEAQALFDRLPDGNAGLPAAAMVLGDGRICAVVRGPLTVANIPALKANCDRLK